MCRITNCLQSLSWNFQMLSVNGMSTLSSLTCCRKIEFILRFWGETLFTWYSKVFKAIGDEDLRRSEASIDWFSLLNPSLMLGLKHNSNLSEAIRGVYKNFNLRLQSCVVRSILHCRLKCFLFLTQVESVTLNEMGCSLKKQIQTKMSNWKNCFLWNALVYVLVRIEIIEQSERQLPLRRNWKQRTTWKRHKVISARNPPFDIFPSCLWSWMKSCVKRKILKDSCG